MKKAIQEQPLKGLLLPVEKIDAISGKEVSSFEPLLNNVTEVYPDLMGKLDTKIH